MPEYQWLCWLAILMFVSSSRSTFCNTRPCRWLAILIMILSLALKQDIAVQCCEDLKCRIRVGKESHFIGCWTVGKTSIGSEASLRPTVRDVVTTVSTWNCLSSFLWSPGRPGREAESGDVVMVSAVILDQIRPDPGDNHPSLVKKPWLLPGYSLCVGMRLRLSLQGASLTRLPERTWFLCTGYYVFYRLFPCFGETQYCVSQWLCRTAFNNEKTWPMKRLHWAWWSNGQPRSSPNSLICPESILWGEPWPASLARNQTSISSLPLSL